MSRLLTIAAPGAASNAVGFDSPLVMLKECHRRVEDQCATLQQLAPHLASRGSDAAAAEAANAVLRYFDLAAPNHHADEEKDLFPALLEAMAGSDAVSIRGIIEDLLADHEELDRQWQSLRSVLLQVAAGHGATLDPAAVDAFESAYARHIAREEGEVLPMAERLLSDASLESLGGAMRRRRGAAA